MGDPFLRIILIFLFSFLFLSGCASYSARTTAPTVNEEPTRGASPSVLNDMQQGSTILVSDPAFAAPFEARVGSSYLSALGHPCFRIVPASGAVTGESLALCRNSDNVWAVAPRIFASSQPGGEVR